MKINKIEIANFGIISEISMDISSKAGSLVFLNGRNGRGKTTFQSALKWCFYGDEPEPTKFLSSFALNEAKPGQTINTGVITEIVMDNSGLTAHIERSQVFQKTESGGAKRVGQPQLIVKTRKSEKGAFTDVLANPEAWIGNYFPRRLMDFFLFDGEKMKNFFDLKVKGAVESAVREIANVDRFENIANQMSAAEATLNRKISKLTGAKAEKINMQLEAQQKLLVDLYLDYQKGEAELSGKKERKEEISVILSEREGLTDAAERLKFMELELTSHRDANTQATQDFQTEILTNGIHGLLVSSFPELRKQVNLAKAEDRLPPPFEPDRILKLLDEQLCICGTDLSPGGKEAESLKKLIEKFQVSSILGKVLDTTSKQVDLLEQKMATGWKVIEDKNRAIEKSTKDIERVEAERDRLLEKLQDHDASEIRLLAEERKGLDRSIERLISENATMLAQSEAATHKLETLKKEFELASKGNAEAETLKVQSVFAGEVAKSARQIHKIAINQVRTRIQESFTEKFSTIKNGKFKTEITENFEVRTLNEFGEETELSEGEKMMKAYIFSIVLREVINLGFPLIVDTPFGRLDSPNRAQLAKMLTVFLKEEIAGSDRQAFFLMQDTEYTPYTKKYFESLKPIEVYLAKDVKFENIKSSLGYGIDPDWLLYESWKDWAEKKIG